MAKEPSETPESLKRKLKEKEAELKLLQQITETISYQLNIDDVLREIVNLVSSTMRADSCLIYLARERKLILKASKIPHKEFVDTVVMKFGEGLTGWAAEHRKKVVIEEKAYEDERFLLIPDLSEDQWESFISVPILYGHDIVGVINVQNRKRRVYTAEKIRLLETIASQVGGAILNAKLISETQALKDALETRKVVEKAKGLLMKKYETSEEKAYALIQKKAMDSKKTMKEVAEAIILTLS